MIKINCGICNLSQAVPLAQAGADRLHAWIGREGWLLVNGKLRCPGCFDRPAHGTKSAPTNPAGQESNALFCLHDDVYVVSGIGRLTFLGQVLEIHGHHSLDPVFMVSRTQGPRYPAPVSATSPRPEQLVAIAMLEKAIEKTIAALRGV